MHTFQRISVRECTCVRQERERGRERAVLAEGRTWYFENTAINLPYLK